MRDSAHTVIQAHNTVNDKAEKIIEILDGATTRETLFIMALVNQAVDHVTEQRATKIDMCNKLGQVNKMLKHMFTMGDQDE